MTRYPVYYAEIDVPEGFYSPKPRPDGSWFIWMTGPDHEIEAWRDQMSKELADLKPKEE